MPVIVEGPDGSGKTTLVKELVSYGYQLRPRHVQSSGETVDLCGYMADETAYWSNDVPQTTWLYDRFPVFGELIYGPAMRDRPSHGLQFMATAFGYASLFWSYNPTVIFCMPPLEVVKENFAATRQMVGLEQELEDVYWRYHLLAAHLWAARPEVYIYDYRSVSAEGLRRRLRERINA